MKKGYYFFCWLPTFGEINFKDRFCEFAKDKKLVNNKIVYEINVDDRNLSDENNSVNIEIEYDENYKVTRMIRKGNSNKECNNKKDYILAEIDRMDEKGNVYFVVNSIDNNGLAKSEKEAKDIASQVYIILKTIYHIHTHHKEDIDLLLSVYKVDGDEKKHLLNEYLKKIFLYHREIEEVRSKVNILKLRERETLMILIKKAYGEMIYAKIYAKLNGFQDKIEIFEEAKDSIRMIVSLDDSYENNINNFLVLLTLVFTILLGIINPILVLIFMILLFFLFKYDEIYFFCYKKKWKRCILFLNKLQILKKLINLV